MEQTLVTGTAYPIGRRPQAGGQPEQGEAMEEAAPVESIEERVLKAALAGLSAHSCRVYTRHLSAFLRFLHTNRCVLSRESVERFTGTIPETSNFNQALSACKRLADQAASHHWIDWATAVSIRTIRAKKQRGIKAGNWLAKEQAQRLLNSPNPGTLRGKRDRTVLALLLGTGIRRDELARLDWNHLQDREGRPYIVDLLGKGNRVRTIAIPDWVMLILDDWATAISPPTPSGRVVRSIRQKGAIGLSLSASAIWNIVLYHAESAQLTCAPHDLRRSYAKLARKHGAPLDVIQKSLGHSSVSTTERYTNSGEQANAGDYFTL